MANPEKPATYGTQDEDKQNKDTAQYVLDTTMHKKVWRYQKGNQIRYIEEEQMTQWPKEKVQKDKQRSTKHTYKTKDRVTRTPLKIRIELGC